MRWIFSPNLIFHIWFRKFHKPRKLSSLKLEVEKENDGIIIFVFRDFATVCSGSSRILNCGQGKIFQQNIYPGRYIYLWAKHIFQLILCSSNAGVFLRGVRHPGNIHGWTNLRRDARFRHGSRVCPILPSISICNVTTTHKCYGVREWGRSFTPHLQTHVLNMHTQRTRVLNGISGQMCVVESAHR